MGPLNLEGLKLFTAFREFEHGQNDEETISPIAQSESHLRDLVTTSGLALRWKSRPSFEYGSGKKLVQPNRSNPQQRRPHIEKGKRSLMLPLLDAHI